MLICSADSSSSININILCCINNLSSYLNSTTFAEEKHHILSIGILISNYTITIIMFAKPTLPILLIIIALNAVCCLAGECSGGNFPCAQLSKEECQNFEWSAWCTINDNKINDWDADCTGTVFCHQASTIHLP